MNGCCRTRPPARSSRLRITSIAGTSITSSARSGSRPMVACKARATDGSADPVDKGAASASLLSTAAISVSLKRHYPAEIGQASTKPVATVAKGARRALSVCRAAYYQTTCSACRGVEDAVAHDKAAANYGGHRRALRRLPKEGIGVVLAVERLFFDNPLLL